MIAPSTFTVVNDAALCAAIAATSQTLVYVAPGISKPVVDAIGDAHRARPYLLATVIIDLDPTAELPNMPIGSKLRIAPNHACLTAAAHDRYYVVDGTDTVQAIWQRVNGW